MIPRKAGSRVSRKITDKVSVIEFKSARAAKEGEVPTGRRDQHPPSESRADNPVTPCCVIRDGDTYALGIDGRFHQPFCMSAFDEKAEIKSSGSRDKPNVGPASASNTRADNPPAPPPCQHSDIDIEDLLAFGYETQWLDGTCAKCDALLRVSVSAIEVKERGV